MKKYALDIVALTSGVSDTDNFAIVLAEQEGERRIPIIIGNAEAQAIAIALEGLSPNRPFTHDLFKNALDAFDITLQEVIISNFIEGIFYATLVCSCNDDIIEVDSRTSDALALAVRFECPIYTYEFILDSTGVLLNEEGEPEQVPPRRRPRRRRSKTLSDYSVDALNDLLDKVLAEENYERAAQIRDELKRR